MRTGLVSERREFEVVRETVSKDFHLDRRFPESVFKNPKPRTLFCQDLGVMGPSFWPAIQRLARVHGDDRIDFLVLEPDAETYYREGYGIYPAISLPVDSSEDDYWNSVSYEPDGDPTGALVFSARVFAVSGPSGKWGCWGELGVEVVAVQGIPDYISDREWCDEFGNFLRAREALNDYISLTFRDQKVPDWFSCPFVKNYDG
jgi:hypothetical protein